MHDVIVPLEQEGTTAKVHHWYVKTGDTVALNDPLVELETDKVTVEVPAPVSGVVAEILIGPESEAKPGDILARIDTSANAAAEHDQPVAEAPAAPAQTPAAVAALQDTRHSPAVRKALAETGLDPRNITATGRDGRLTRYDVRSAAKSRPTTAAPAPASAATPASENSIFVPHDRMRLAIARNMLASVLQAPQVTAVFEADFGPLIAHRNQHKSAFAKDSINLSYTAYIVMACVAAMRAVPEVNSRWHDDRLEIFRDVNIGVGTALGDKGLLVPVIRQAQQLSLQGVATALQDQVNRARDGKLTPADMAGGTFTISNYGVSGALLAAPVIINQPQSAILGVGKLEKRAVIREIDGVDSLQIRPMAYVSLTVDHRVLDGYQTNAWLTAFVKSLEGWTV